ncbi:radical SAM protein [Aquisphaera insulae]|uniref:radical SAM protein n=1 Tax=Aquisphaera insulae TaxID=2712864 RepID=UPI0013EC288A|nr:radical SAM protein [Aquisphaera insulae]
MEPALLTSDHPLSDAQGGDAPGRMIDTLIFKVASRCNMNCRYCYMYNLADTTWKLQPRFMSDEVFSTAIGRWRDHVRGRGAKHLHLVLHGGEPLLAGPDRLDRWMTLARRELDDLEVPLSIGIQTNGLLIGDESCEVFDRHGAAIGVSIDGVPGKGDLLRIDHAGRPTGSRVEARLRWLVSSRWRHTLGGILSVVNVECDPIETMEYVMSFGSSTCDFRLPLCNHDSPPSRPGWDTDGTSYGRWLARVFDHAIENDVPCRVRILDAVINAGVNRHAYQSLIGNSELSRACVIETDGSYEFTDNLKSAREGITKTGLSVARHTLDDYCRHAGAWSEQYGLGGMDSPARRCRDCPVWNQCGGFYYANRFRSANAFANESVFCSDLRYLFDHVRARIQGR